jgi:hypothetical protein
VPTAKYDAANYAWHGHKFFELAALHATPGFLPDDTLVLTVDISVQREARFALDSGAVDAATRSEVTGWLPTLCCQLSVAPPLSKAASPAT